MSDVGVTERYVREQRQIAKARFELAISMLTNAAYGGVGAAVIDALLDGKPEAGHYMLGLIGAAAAFVALLLVPMGRVE